MIFSDNASRLHNTCSHWRLRPSLVARAVYVWNKRWFQGTRGGNWEGECAAPPPQSKTLTPTYIMAYPSNCILVWVWFVLGWFLFSPFLSFTPCLNSPFGDSDCVWRARIRMPYFCMSLPLGNSLILLNLHIGRRPLVVPTTFSDIVASVSSWLQSLLGFLVWFSRLLWLFGLCTPQTGLNTWCDIRLKITRTYYVHEKVSVPNTANQYNTKKVS